MGHARRAPCESREGASRVPMTSPYDVEPGSLGRGQKRSRDVSVGWWAAESRAHAACDRGFRPLGLRWLVVAGASKGPRASARARSLSPRVTGRFAAFGCAQETGGRIATDRARGRIARPPNPGLGATCPPPKPRPGASDPKPEAKRCPTARRPTTTAHPPRLPCPTTPRRPPPPGVTRPTATSVEATTSKTRAGDRGLETFWTSGAPFCNTVFRSALAFDVLVAQA